MSWKKGVIGLAALTLPLVAIMTAAGVPGDTSGTRRTTAAHEWKDAEGRVIKRVDQDGRMLLLTWDEKGRLVRAAGIQRKVDPRTTKGEVPSGEAWVHDFQYREDGRLAVEIDCVGNMHRLETTVTVDPRRGTLIPGHRHVEEAGTVPVEAPGRAATVFTYDDSGSVIEVSR